MQDINDSSFYEIGESGMLKSSFEELCYSGFKNNEKLLFHGNLFLENQWRFLDERTVQW